MTDQPILQVQDLHIRFDTPDGEVHAVRGIDLEVHKGETVAIVGESGSGKSQSVMAAMGLLADNGRATGSITYKGRELVGLPQKELNKIRGVNMSMIFQEPMTSLDPLYTIERQISEPLWHHKKMNKADARARVLELLELVHMPEAERRLKSYPHELSGGQRQRVMIAMALANAPDILIADEPTTALDVTIQAEILKLIAEIQQRLNMAIIFITHDLNIVRKISDRVYVMQLGEIVEHGPTKNLFADPQEDYTKFLLAAEPEGAKEPPDPASPIMIRAEQVQVRYDQNVALTQANIELKKGQTIGLVGESGSGKTTFGRALLHLVPSEGTVWFQDKDLNTVGAEELRNLRREIQVVFQDPYGSLSPRMNVGQIITEGLLIHQPELTAGDRDRAAAETLARVQLDPSLRNRYPHEFSGGQRQRIAIARAIILKPKVIVLDEPTSALDRSVQKDILELLRELQNENDLSYIFISHDLAVVRAICDYILVMKDGHIVESGWAQEIFEKPQETYTQQLLEAAFG